MSLIDDKKNAEVPIDPWHWDSVAYTGVILLNEVTQMDGGALELMKMEKRKALKELEANRIVHDVHTDIIGYENPGKMIFAQGSEVLHHVTPVLNDERRLVHMALKIILGW